MAGIGFELKKVLSQKSLSGFFKASISGIFIVSGPWLLSIISLGFISLIVKNSSINILDQFFGILVYIFAISLILTGGIQYLFTRLFSDFIYDNRVNESLFIIILYLITTGILSFIIGGVISAFILGFNFDNFLLIFACAFQSSVINMLWIILIFVSFLKWFKKILLFFLVGIIIMVFIIFFAGINQLSHLLITYTLGNLFTLIALIYLSVKDYTPKRIRYELLIMIFVDYWQKYKYLFFTGMLYYATFWVDKILYWIFFGEYIDQINIKLLYSYDMSMYIANISTIPGMVYFIINSETTFFMKIKKFLISLSYSDYRTIRINKNRLKKSAHDDINRQTMNQSLITSALCLLSYYIFPEFYITMILALWAANFQLIFFTYINYLFYMNKYNSSFIIVFLTTLVNIILFFLYYLLPIENIPGFSYLVSSLIGCILAYNVFNYSVDRLDMYVYTGNNN